MIYKTLSERRQYIKHLTKWDFSQNKTIVVMFFYFINTISAAFEIVRQKNVAFMMLKVQIFERQGLLYI